MLDRMSRSARGGTEMTVAVDFDHVDIVFGDDPAQRAGR